ncbi:unnamed protein product [Blepharisma stoltei]|uniref:Uncharacterized protein n=1 Tax=Blepharisma stoltei TaxID=1481888 RepID=A0AAU9I789_9CILI|nr:unnamed protein product [Blepharisma stoltei]
MNSTGIVFMKSLTWSRDSHGLFDYESRNILKRNLKAYGPCEVLRKGNEVTLCTSMNGVSQHTAESLPLASLFQTETGLFYIKPVENEQLWLVVRSYKQPGLENGYQLSEGDVVKFGRVRFRVRSVKTSPSAEPEGIDEEALIIDSSLESENKTCRICLSDGSEHDNPMISPCKCSGSVKYIHLLCLVRWITSRLAIKADDNLHSYYWKSVDCEICKHAFPMTINYQGRINELFPIEKPAAPYLILEEISKERSSKSIHVIHLRSKDTVRLGRGHESEVRISDISVSRCHAIISYRNGSFYLEDNKSKFGTLIEVSEGYALDANSQIAMQVGRTVISFSIKGEGQNHTSELESLNMSLDETVADPDFEED